MRDQMLRMLMFSLVFSSFACSTSWVMEDSPTNEDLYGVCHVSEVGTFAVGANGTALIRVNDSWWELDTGVDEDLLDVWGASASSTFAVGADCTVLKYNPPADGASPETATFEKLDISGCGNLFSIDGRADVIWVAGTLGIRRLSGQSLGVVGSFGIMTGVSLSEGGRRLVVGNEGVLGMHDGSRWTMHEITVCPLDLVEGQCPMEVIRPVLWDAWLSSEGRGVIVGSNGGIWDYPPPAEGPWNSLASYVDGEIKAVHGFFEGGTETAFAVGSSGSVIKIQGTNTNHENVGSNEDLEGVWGSDDGLEVFIVGSSGTIVHISR